MRLNIVRSRATFFEQELMGATKMRKDNRSAISAEIIGVNTIIAPRMASDSTIRHPTHV